MTSTTTPPKVVEQWRAEFEASFPLEKKNELKLLTTGEYFYQRVWDQWKGFLLGRQTTCIELPEPLEFDDGHDEPSCHYWPTQIKNAIKSQGYQVRVKGE